ncbi:MAG: hypothetical protein NTW86_16450 [Candidatus Sumerlaeota bacterium]|nr:hypothetical protein [Candidatus Sumerlaeota bacterium]
MAAIAVPNFLEAQVRSKVSRAKSDMRSITTGLEAYAVDWNRTPLGFTELQKNKCCGAAAFWNPIPSEIVRVAALSKLTTPVAYMSSVPADVFKEKGAVNVKTTRPNNDSRVYVYQTCYECLTNNGNPPEVIDAMELGYKWALRSAGPLRNENGNVYYVLTGTPQANPAVTNCSYDPTNGTTSIGWILRTNKGQFTVPGS